ncbi:DUF4979 domain-containing protein [Mariniflexile litorale]|uniref:DUF4979 domain-containing protein n=1 Tax=Mariniflexile litorale TaxID=3045158 RepID=A0AAU7ECU5_9FLAO|nr:DUF4979 domain-containing protein [Mariniflexile sp. KMM 9835]MDQ8213467.1 DUF4979 domain-containing protein [Mariniflexile sp. KMM 9835]
MKKNKIILSVFTVLTIGFLSLMLSCVNNDELEVYQYPEPTLDGFSPSEGVSGTEITILGADFGTYKKAVSVFFNGVETPQEDILSVVDNQIVTKVPSGALSGEVVVKVWTHNKTLGTFNVLPSAVYDSMSPLFGMPAEELTITGENFGNDASKVTVTFKGGVEAEIVSVSNTEIKVIVPDGGITGVISVQIDIQSFETDSFAYPLVGLDFMFDVAGDNEGWLTTHNSTTEVSNGNINVTFDMSASNRRADFKLDGGAKVNVGGFPILAIKLNKPQSGNFILDTNFGSYKNGSNNWEGIINGDIYYYDLRNTFGSSNTLSLTDDTEFTTLQFKIADIITAETGYSVDWIRSFESIDALNEYTELPNGKFSFHFDAIPESDYWVANYNASNVVEDGKLKVTFDPAQFDTDKRRADLNFVEGGIFPGTSPNGKWHYSTEYPILAIKIAFTGTGAPTPETGSIKLDRFMGAPNNAYLLDFLADNVIYYDCSVDGGFTVSQDLASFTFKIADITSTGETGYELDWIQSFRTVVELQAYIASH